MTSLADISSQATAAANAQGANPAFFVPLMQSEYQSNPSAFSDPNYLTLQAGNFRMYQDSTPQGATTQDYWASVIGGFLGVNPQSPTVQMSAADGVNTSAQSGTSAASGIIDPIAAAVGATRTDANGNTVPLQTSSSTSPFWWPFPDSLYTTLKSLSLGKFALFLIAVALLFIAAKGLQGPTIAIVKNQAGL